MLPRQKEPENSKMGWFIAGGPLASFILGIITIVILLFLTGSTETRAGNFILYSLFTVGFISFVIGFLSIIPTESKIFESDGTQLIDLCRGGERALIKQQLMSLSVAVWNGTRPREIDKEILDSVLVKTESKTNPQAHTARLILVYYHLDMGNVNEAEVILESLIEQFEKENNSLLEGSVYIEKAYISAAYRKDTKTAEPFLEKGKKGFVEEQTIARAESAFLIANGETDKGIARANQGLEVADNSMDKGSAMFEKEILSQLARGDLPALVFAAKQGR